jgi:hypothetical protein
MGFITALLVFLFPLGMPIFTLIVVLKVSFSKHPLPIRLLQSVFIAGVLALVLGPAIERGGAGSFALPWWLLLTSNSEYYVWQYGLFVLASSSVLALLVSGVRALRTES